MPLWLILLLAIPVSLFVLLLISMAVGVVLTPIDEGI